MKRPIAQHLLLFLLCSASAPPASAQLLLMRDVFAAMPDSVAPMVTKNNRLDCIDFIENNMEAKVRNVLEEYVTLEALTSDYARFRTSAASLLEMKLLPVSDSTSVLCLLRTAQTGEPDTPRRLEETVVRFLHPDWTPLDSAARLSLPAVSAFILEPAPDSLRATFDQALRSLESFHPVHLTLAADDVTLTATLQPAYLAKDEREAVAPRLRPLRFRWNGHRFLPE